MTEHATPEERLERSRQRLRLLLRAQPPPALDALSAAFGMATQSLDTLLKPLAQRHPVGLVLTAFIAGGLIAFTKPWRWISLPALSAEVLPQMLAKVVSLIPPTDWLDKLSAMLGAGTDPKSGQA